MSNPDKYQGRRDDALMQLGGHYDSPIAGLSFVVPTACTGTTNKGNDDKAPEIWLRDGKHTNDQIAPEHGERLLTREEAMAYAGGIDKIAKPRALSMRRPEEGYPVSYAVLVAMFYDTLGRRLELAILKAEDRRLELREARAALTGKTS